MEPATAISHHPSIIQAAAPWIGPTERTHGSRHSPSHTTEMAVVLPIPVTR
jgi:hypothetical protein